jgi:predicted permease
MGWHLPEVATASLRQIGTAAGGMGLLVTGVVLSETPFRLTMNTSLGVAFSNIVQPLFAYGICRAVGAPDEITKLSVIMAALPSGFFGILFGNSYDRVSSEANATIIASTLFSVLSLAVAVEWTLHFG